MTIKEYSPQHYENVANRLHRQQAKQEQNNNSGNSICSLPFGEKEVEKMVAKTFGPAVAEYSIGTIDSVNFPHVDIKDGDVVQITLLCDGSASSGGIQYTGTGETVLSLVAKEVTNGAGEIIGLRFEPDEPIVVATQSNGSYYLRIKYLTVNFYGNAAMQIRWERNGTDAITSSFPVTITLEAEVLTTATEVEQLDAKYLEPFETVGGDTLTWNGDTEGRYMVDLGGFLLYLVSEATPTVTDMANGLKFTTEKGEVMECQLEEVAQVLDNGIIGSEMFCVIPQDNCDFNGITFEKKGLYLGWLEGFNNITSLTINGFTGFPATKLKEEYLPEQSSGVTTFYSGSNHRLYLDPYQEEMVKKSDVITAMKKGVIRIGDGDGDSGTYEYPISIDTVSDSAYITIVKWTDDSVTTDYFVTAEEFEG